MQPQIIGISGSPVKDSNTDRAVQAVLAASGLPSEFVKLSKLKVGPCHACLGCASDNVCKLNDDFPALAEKLKKAQAVVVGGYPTFGSLDGFTKCFLERLFSMRHQKGLDRGKLAVTVTTALGGGAPGMDEAAGQIAHALTMEGMEVLGQVKVRGNAACLSCGYGEACPMSALPWIYGREPKIKPEMFSKLEEQPEVMGQIQELGQELGRRVKAQA